MTTYPPECNENAGEGAVRSTAMASPRGALQSVVAEADDLSDLRPNCRLRSLVDVAPA